jgi:hypothetical protein
MRTRKSNTTKAVTEFVCEFICTMIDAHTFQNIHSVTYYQIAGKDRVETNKNAKNKCVLLAQGEGGHGGHPKLAQ